MQRSKFLRRSTGLSSRNLAFASRPDEGGVEEAHLRSDDYLSLDKVEDLPARCKAWIGDMLEYSYRFWTNHLAGVSSAAHDVERVQKAVDELFATWLLFWIEVLITGNLDMGVYTFNDVQQWYKSVSCVRSVHSGYVFMLIQTEVSCKHANEDQRFLPEYSDTIHDSPSHIHHSALPLCPASS